MRKIKNIVATLLVAVMALSMNQVQVMAETLSGQIDENSWYEYSEDEQTLTISGNGIAGNYSMLLALDSRHIKVELRKLIISEGVTELQPIYGAYLNLEEVVLPESLMYLPDNFNIYQNTNDIFVIPENIIGIGEHVFFSTPCKRMVVPASVTKIGYRSFSTDYTILCSNDTVTEYATTNGLSYIDLRTMNNLADSSVTTSASVVATGSNVEPEVTVTVNGITLLPEEYDVSYSNNVNPGTATATVTGTGYFTGTKSVNFQITKSIGNCNVVSNANPIFIYSGEGNTLPIEVYDNNTKLTEGIDYDLTYSDTVNAGNVVITVTGKGNYTGMSTMEYSVNAADISRADITLSETDVLSTGSNITPVATVKLNGKTLAEGTDYTVSYANNLYKGTATVTITGKGNYVGSKKVNFNITSYDLTECDIKLEHTVFTFTGSKKFPKVNVTSKDGVALTEGVDYVLDYVNNINEGNASVIISGINNWNGDLECNFVITAYSNGTDLAYEYGEAFLDGDLLYGVIDDEENCVEVYGITNSKLRAVVVPATITIDNTKYKVTGIAPNAFKGNKKITSVTIGKYVTSIESNAFYGCTRLKTVKMGGRVELFGDGCFRKCTSLTSIVLPKSVEEIGKNAFYGCKKLKSITIKTDDIEEIGKNAFKGINNKCKITVPKRAVKRVKKQFRKNTGYKTSMTIKAAK